MKWKDRHEISEAKHPKGFYFWHLYQQSMGSKQLNHTGLEYNHMWLIITNMTEYNHTWVKPHMNE